MKSPVHRSVVALALVFVLAAGPALAANNGNHGNSGSHASGGSGNGGSGNGVGPSIQDANINPAESGNGHGHSDANRNIASLAGAGNAAHASVQGLLHASPNSAVGRVRAYADAEYKARQLDKAAADALAACNAALAAADISGDCSSSTLDLTNAPAAVTTAYDAYLAAKQDAATADTTAQADLLKVTKNAASPGVQSYIDGLLTKYYAYLGSAD